MRVAICTIGNSQGVLIPKSILEETGLINAADLQVVNGVIEIRPLKRNPREGWSADSARVAQNDGDAMAWPQFATKTTSLFTGRRRHVATARSNAGT